MLSSSSALFLANFITAQTHKSQDAQNKDAVTVTVNPQWRSRGSLVSAVVSRERTRKTLVLALPAEIAVLRLCSFCFFFLFFFHCIYLHWWFTYCYFVFIFVTWLEFHDFVLSCSLCFSKPMEYVCFVSFITATWVLSETELWKIFKKKWNIDRTAMRMLQN